MKKRVGARTRNGKRDRNTEKGEFHGGEKEQTKITFLGREEESTSG